MQTYFEYYEKEIAPRIKAIDVFLKTEPQPYDIADVARLLMISKEELVQLAEEKKIEFLSKGTFLFFLLKADSPICNLITREQNIGSPQIYTVEDIAYIYHLEQEDVKTAAEEMGQFQFLSSELLELFRYITISGKQYQL